MLNKLFFIKRRLYRMKKFMKFLLMTGFALVFANFSQDELNAAMDVKKACALLKLDEKDRLDQKKVNKAFRLRALAQHPDKGGREEEFKELNAAKDYLLEKIEQRNLLKKHHEEREKQFEAQREQARRRQAEEKAAQEAAAKDAAIERIVLKVQITMGLLNSKAARDLLFSQINDQIKTKSDELTYAELLGLTLEEYKTYKAYIQEPEVL